MTDQQEAHLQYIKERFYLKIGVKYRAGQKEHGGNLWEKPTIKNLSEEIIDLQVYFHTLEDHISYCQGLMRTIKDVLSHGEVGVAKDLLDLLDSALCNI
jgi:hypothetical protein